jgi:hypothetical protein
MKTLFVALATSVSVLRAGTESFTPIAPSLLSNPNGNFDSSSSSSSALQIGNFFGGILKGKAVEAGSKDDNGGGVMTVLDIPANVVKIGALKFYLQIFFVGEQNKPVKGSWALSQNEARGTLDMYYADGTGMFSIDLKEYGIKVQRYGQKPSLQYLLQESVLLHCMLDELTQIAFNVDDIDQDKRLLQFPDELALSKVRESLPARKEEGA